jgi:undecaprenyl-diphosphatase
MLATLDIAVLHALNAAADNPVMAKLLFGLGNVQLARGFPIFFALVWLWFSGGTDRRARMLSGMLGLCVALACSLWMQHHLAIHTRPFLDPALHLNLPNPEITKDWDRRNSFPSDTATLFFSLAAIIAIETPIVGFAAAVWVLVAVGLVRVALGYHYPSDILGAAVLGPALVLLFASRPARRLVARLPATLERYQPAFHALFFLFVAEAYGSFSSLERAANAVEYITTQQHAAR